MVALEAVEIGFGGAGRNVGLVNAGLWLQPRDIIKRLGLDYGERILSLLGEARPKCSSSSTRTPSIVSQCATARCIARSAARARRKSRSARSSGASAARPSGR